METFLLMDALFRVSISVSNILNFFVRQMKPPDNPHAGGML